MIVGFNHNVTYRNTGFHVQTEDSGMKRAQLVTLLYHGGVIISSKKTIYADIIKVDNLDLVIEELAKEQHKGMLRSLTQGEFDQRIVELGIPLGAAVEQSSRQAAASDPTLDTETSSVEKAPVIASTPEPVTIVEEPIGDKFSQPKGSNEPSLDELIYAYLTAGQNQA
ncbi:MAG: hypothetical protein U9R69_08345 [Thermodesulfobacteriota bacterium]|nr:hypothetical protein [Thermodesulfobacteriota bacterium]